MGQSSYSTTARNAQLTALIALLNGGKLVVYDGPQPATCDTAISGSNHVLATFTLPNPSATVAAAVLTMNAITAVAIALSGVANWFRIYEADGTTALADGNIGSWNSIRPITLSAQANATATSINVTQLEYPLYAGQDLIFNDGGALKLAHVSADTPASGIGVPTTVPVTSLGQTISSGAATVANAIVNSPKYAVNAQASLSACTITAPAAGT